MPVAWYAKKQPTVALSTAEAEYIAGSIAVKECLWVRQLLQELMLISPDEPICLQIDNQSAIKTMENEITSDRMKHVNIRFHFIRDTIKRGDVALNYCSTESMKADILTKPLNTIIHQRLVSALRLTTPPTTTAESSVPYPVMTGACQMTVCWARTAFPPDQRGTLSSAVPRHRSEPATRLFDGARRPPEWYSPWSLAVSQCLKDGCQVPVLMLCFRSKEGLSRRGPEDMIVVSKDVRAELTRFVR
ncbi:hypothetical protein PR003_g18412 [Phytophthora rubi]|uniref:Reverse transcriptase Ty1/copia-type domain-containing protein n=1 Tax=Phytophthora rubi TaxID=129364 RepID=A0A6A4EEG2_9STRA|nr:hypothetical protein PR001_g17519 [Phytophthora rubi]KAE9317715.1 hypothetical protein PR003_g18412 [Phytophthora rubi]